MPVTLLKGPFTVDDYHRMAECGILGEDDRVELVNGQVVEMSPIGNRHASTVGRLTELFGQRKGGQAILWVQNPIRLGRHSEPQPDVCLPRPRADFYGGGHPEAADILLLVEVADTSADYDREVKIPLYARAGVPETWLVNLPTERIEVYRNPGPEGYADVRTAGRGDRLTPLLLDDVTLGVGDILG